MFHETFVFVGLRNLYLVVSSELFQVSFIIVLGVLAIYTFTWKNIWFQFDHIHKGRQV